MWKYTSPGHPPTPHTKRHGSPKHPATRASPGFQPPRCTSDKSDFLSFSGSLCDVGTIVLISQMRNQGFGDMKAVAKVTHPGYSRAPSFSDSSERWDWGQKP